MGEVQTGHVTLCDTCQILRENNWLWPVVSSQIITPFLNRRQPLKLFNFLLINCPSVSKKSLLLFDVSCKQTCVTRGV